MKAINFLSRSVQDLANHGLRPNVTLLREIDMECANFYKFFQHYLTQTKSSSDYSRVIDLLILKRNMMPKIRQFSKWMQNMVSTLDEATYFGGFTLFSHMVRETDGYIDYVYLAQDTTFVDCCKVVARLEGKHFEEDNQTFYTSLRIFIANCGIGYCVNHNTKKRG